MQDSSINSLSKPKPRKSLRLRKKRFTNKYQNEKCLLSSDVLFATHDPVQAAVGSRTEPSTSPPDGQLSHPTKRSDDMLKYSSLLLKLRNKLVQEGAHTRTAATNVSVGLNKKRVPLYSPLTQDSLLYPYANLLLELHKKVAASHRQSGKQQHRTLPDRTLSQIMNDLDHPIDHNVNEYKENCDTNPPYLYTKKLQNFVILETLRKTILGECASPGSSCDDHSGEGATVGEVMSDLGRQRPRELYPSSEFYYSSLLLKACSANSVDQIPNLEVVSDGGGDTDGNTSSWSDDRDCSTSSKSSDSYEEWSPSYRKRKVRMVRKRSTKTRLSVRESSVPASASPGEREASCDTHQNNAPTLLKLLLSKDGSYDATSTDSLPSQSRTAAATANLPSQGSSANGLHGSLLKNFLCKSSDEFEKYYSKIRENRENRSARTSLQGDSDVNCLHGQSQNSCSTTLGMSKGDQKEASIPDLIPCTLVSNIASSCVTDLISSESSEVDVGCTFLEEHESKPVPQAMSLTVASMLCRLNLYPHGDGGATGGDLMAPCINSVSSGRDKQSLGASGVGRCRGVDEESNLEEHQCSLCRLPFVSSLDLQCHQSLFHAAHSSSEKLRN